MESAVVIKSFVRKGYEEEMLDALDAVEPSGPVQPTHLGGTFEVRHVSFTYPTGTTSA
ncbi:hypothetical protein IC235_10770 [Hymenobacter sp. BT664]|uniref:Uncharacterized protein n=1 Tax=Hymenobacter montanus TaxID=2771359 RepID=A0A927BDH4_9BACT|nr:hypothetical protein [Hymenobacter montanus]MBD2768376.1 hypothetical protein [Hymenobacter montanus]